jgi:hypothetical protein
MDIGEEIIVSALNIPYLILILARNTYPIPDQKGTYEHLDSIPYRDRLLSFS